MCLPLSPHEQAGDSLDADGCMFALHTWSPLICHSKQEVKVAQALCSAYIMTLSHCWSPSSKLPSTVLSNSPHFQVQWLKTSVWSSSVTFNPNASLKASLRYRLNLILISHNHFDAFLKETISETRTYELRIPQTHMWH